MLYLGLAYSAFRFTQGQGSSQAGAEPGRHGDAGAERPAAALLVGVVGLVVLGVGAYLVYKGATKKFLEDLHRHRRHAARWARPSASSAWSATSPRASRSPSSAGCSSTPPSQADAAEATGLDGAFRTIGEQPFGQVLLLLMGLGIAAFGVYLFARARYQRM